MTQDNAPQECDTIIIGAGISGLACASKLLEDPSYQKSKKLVVLEARDRVGGRIESVHVLGNRLDTGANFIHGPGTKDAPNPLMAILPHKRMRELSQSVILKAPKGGALIEQKDLVIPTEASGEVMAAFMGLITSLFTRAATISKEQARKTSVLEAIENDEAFLQAFRDIPEEYRDTVGSLAQFVEIIEAAPLNASSAEHVSDHPGMGLLEYAVENSEGSNIWLTDGYTPVVAEVGRQAINQGHVKLGIEVQQISWGESRIRVETINGSYLAKKVVSTIPLGVLQKHIQSSGESGTHQPFFVPQLPAAKVESITSLGFGTLDKIFLVYSSSWWIDEPYASIFKKGMLKMEIPDASESPWWTEGFTAEKSTAESLEFDTLWGFTTELPGLSISPSGTTSGPQVLSVLNLHSLSGVPALSAFVSCSRSIHVESVSDTDAGLLVHRSLTKWLGIEPPKPDAVHVTRWAADKYSMGSYSHMIKGLSENRHREEFANPIINEHGAELRFAGEHTTANNYAMVHGALLSGWREAQAILNSEKKNSLLTIS